MRLERSKLPKPLRELPSGVGLDEKGGEVIASWKF